MSSHIKRMKLKGFKSFANPTVLKFEEGFNTVVGANGSGKSNVFDALCFVLGRMSSKGLRADKLGNLVFNGGKNLKPAKEAEVEIFLDNASRSLMENGPEEVKVSRIVKKDGSSKYLLNNTKVTRTEIVEILRRASIDPDGYNIILQGDIMKIVNMTSVERRELIEEISDISGYEEKREKAMKKLGGIEDDLKEADLLLDEKTKFLKELKSEKEQAEKYHQTKEDLRFNNLLLVKAKLLKNALIKKRKEEELKISEDKIAEIKEKLDNYEQRISEINNEISNVEKEIEIKSHNDFISVTNKITALESEIKNLDERKAENKKQFEEIKIRKSGVIENIKSNNKKKTDLELEINELELKRKSFQKSLAEIEAKLANLKTKVSSTSFKEIDEIDEKIDELNQKKHDKDLVRQDNSLQIERMNTKIEHLEADLNRIGNNLSSNKEQQKQLEENRKKLKELIMSISTKANQNSETSARLGSLQKEYSTLVEEHSRLRMKAEASKDLMATNKAVDNILKLKSRDKSIHGSVAELASVPQQYSLALETVAGKSLFNIVVENDVTAVKYINYLKENKVGNATFLPLNKVHAKYRLDDRVLNKKGVIDYALNLIRFDPRYENIFHLIFGDTVVIEKIEDAKGVGIGDYKMVTLEGDIVAKSGAMSGGFRARNKSLGAFKDEKLLERLSEMDRKVMSIQSSVEHLKDEKESQEREIYELRQEKIEVEGEVAKLEKMLSIEGRDTDSIKREIENISSDKAVIENSLKKIDRDIKELNEEIAKFVSRKNELKSTNSSHSDILSNITKVEEEKDKLKSEILEINSKIDANKININNVIIPENQSLDKILKDSENSIAKIGNLISDAQIKLKDMNDELKLLKSKEKELSKDYKQYIDKREKLKDEKIKTEEKYYKEYKGYDSEKDKNSQLKYSINEFETLSKTLEEELEILYEELRAEFVEININELIEDEDLEREIEDSRQESERIMGEGQKKIDELITKVNEELKKESTDVKELQTKVNNLKTKLTSYGSINMKAVKIYDKLNEEFNLLIDKRKTLNEEKNEILVFIGEMDEKKKERFMETFVKLKEHFINIFSKLSTKGEVELNIEDEKNLFESGVEIRVKLSKNNYLDIKSLSGGEKTITAIAFIFAVQEFNPASFYIFDEVDAALDIMNCEKLGKLIKEYSRCAQYIVVSHSEYLIQSAESIYGVTMDRNKISGVVSLDLKNATEYVET